MDRLTDGQMPVKQECIPVECVPSAAAAVSGGGGAYFLGMLPSGGCFLLGVLPSRGVLPRGGGCFLPGEGVASFTGGSFPGAGGGGIPACTEADTPSVNRMTDRCKNITFTTSLRTVNITFLQARYKRMAVRLKCSKLISIWIMFINCVRQVSDHLHWSSRQPFPK